MEQFVFRYDFLVWIEIELNLIKTTAIHLCVCAWENWNSVCVFEKTLKIQTVHCGGECVFF